MKSKALVKQESSDITRGVEIKTLDDLERAAKLAAASGFFGNARDLARGCMIMQYGLELSITPIAALQNINVIEGKLSMGGSMIAALIKGSGKYNYKQVEVSDKQARIMFFENGVEQGMVSYTIAEARAAGLANKQNWRKNTKDMLWWRAMSRGARRFCPDIFNGSIYTPEELSEGEHAPDDYTMQQDEQPAVVNGESVEKRNQLREAVHEAFKDKEVKVVEVETAKEPEPEPEPVVVEQVTEKKVQPKKNSATALMLNFMRAVDSCEDPVDADNVMDDWEDILKELPRGYENCVAYWKASSARLAGDPVDDETQKLADQMAAIKN